MCSYMGKICCCFTDANWIFQPLIRIMNEYLNIAGKSVAVYLFIIIAIRLFGKKELAQLSVIDLVFILLISNSVQNAMVGNDTTLPGGMVAALGLFIANYIFKLFLRRSQKFSDII